MTNIDGFDLVKVSNDERTLIVDSDKKELINPNDYSVFQGNRLIQASYRLTITENKLMHWLISKITPYDEDFKEYTITIKDFMAVTGVNDQELYCKIPIILKGLTTRSIILKDVDGVLGKDAYMTWLAYAEHNKGQGSVSLMFHPRLKPYLVQLKDSFTSYSLKEFMKLDSFYAGRFYELLKQQENLTRGKCNLTIEDLHWHFGINKGSYLVYNRLKEKVIEPSIEKINLKTDLSVTYTEKKIGRKVGSIDCIIKRKSKSISVPASCKNQQSLPEESPLVKKLTDIGFPFKKVIELLEKHPESIIVDNLEILKSKSHIKHKSSYLLTMLQNEQSKDVDNGEDKLISSTFSFEGTFAPCLKTLCELVGTTHYQSWFNHHPINFYVENNRLSVLCLSKFCLDSIEKNDKHHIIKAWTTNGYPITDIQFLYEKPAW